MDEKYKIANTKIHSEVQLLSQSSLPLDSVLVYSLLLVFACAPPEACMRAAPLLNEIQGLIQHNSDLREVLQDAIHRGRYEDVMSLRRCLRNIY